MAGIASGGRQTQENEDKRIHNIQTVLNLNKTPLLSHKISRFLTALVFWFLPGDFGLLFFSLLFSSLQHHITTSHLGYRNTCCFPPQTLRHSPRHAFLLFSLRSTFIQQLGHSFLTRRFTFVQCSALTCLTLCYIFATDVLSNPIFHGQCSC